MSTSFAKKFKGTRRSMRPTSAKAVAKAQEHLVKDIPSAAQGWSTQQAHASRDMMKAVDFMYQYNPSFDAANLKHKVPEMVQKQIDLLIDASTHMAVVNFFRFDKCPQGVLHFLQQYMLLEEPSLMSPKLSQELLAIIACVDPLERVRQFRRILEVSPVRTVMRKLFLYFHYLVVESSQPQLALENIVRMFTSCFFKDALKSSSKYKRRKRAMKFLIQRAQLVFEDTSAPKEEEEEVPLVVTADRGLGTDGLLFLIDRKAEDVRKGFVDMDYGSETHGLHKELLAVQAEMEELEQSISGLGSMHGELDGKFTSVWEECNTIIEMVERGYEKLPRELPKEEEGGLSEEMRMMDELQAC